MATAEQIKSLIRSHFSDESEHFYTIALQLAAHEAKQGHTALAFEIREIIDRSRNKKKNTKILISKETLDFISKDEGWFSGNSLVLSAELYSRIERIIHEYRQQYKLKSYGLENRRKILLIGPPGTGKTMTARVIAKELNLYLYTIQMDRILTKFMGESSAKLRQVFDMIQYEQGVYLFDEFDAIGGNRSNDNDVGEMRRILNAFLQFIDQDRSDSLIVAATNNASLLDQALFRRFDDVLYYDHPSSDERKSLIQNVLGTFLSNSLDWKEIINSSEGLSHADIDNACRNAIKNSVLIDKPDVESQEIIQSLKQRQRIYRGLMNNYDR